MRLQPIIIYLVIGAMGAFILVSAIKYFVAGNKLRQNGNLVEGRIIEHYTERDLLGARYSPDYVNILKYSFEYQGKSFTQQKRVSEETYRAFSDGDTIRVRCLPDHPIIADAVDF